VLNVVITMSISVTLCYFCNVGINFYLVMEVYFIVKGVNLSSSLNCGIMFLSFVI
jgi:hypothetical protein